MNRELKYNIGLSWLGGVNKDKNYRYDKTYELSFKNKPSIKGSADVVFHGDKNLYNPEEMLLAALSSCHMMSFFYLCGINKIEIKSYVDSPQGFLEINTNGSGQFKNVVLEPTIILSEKEDLVKMATLFKQASDYCFIARSCNFEIAHLPNFRTIQEDCEK